jgi:hypothetical protein
MGRISEAPRKGDHTLKRPPPITSFQPWGMVRILQEQSTKVVVHKLVSFSLKPAATSSRPWEQHGTDHKTYKKRVNLGLFSFHVILDLSQASCLFPPSSSTNHLLPAISPYKYLH